MYMDIVCDDTMGRMFLSKAREPGKNDRAPDQTHAADPGSYCELPGRFTEVTDSALFYGYCASMPGLAGFPGVA